MATKPKPKETPWIVMEGNIEPRPNVVTLRPRDKDAGWRLVFDRSDAEYPDAARLLFDGEPDSASGIAFDVRELDYLGQACIVMAAEMERQGVDPR